MANPNPSPETRWPPGTSGNPAGYSRGRRVTDRLIELIESGGHSEKLARVWLGAALGDTALLDGNEPDFRFFRELLDRLEGKVADKVEHAESRAAPHQIPDDDPRFVASDEYPAVEGDPRPDAGS